MKIKRVQAKTIKSFLDKEWALYNKKYTKIRYIKKYSYFAAYEGKKIVGVITIETSGGLCYVKDLLVADGYRKKGIGARMWDTAEKFAKAQKCRRIAIKTNEFNVWAIKFYKKHGLKRDATLKDYQFGLKWYFMSKKI
jgi:GNAT superfamily N-acetyltransferase